MIPWFFLQEKVPIELHTFLRPGSYVAFQPCRIKRSHLIFSWSNSIQRIKFNRNSTSETAAALRPHVRLVLSHCPTEVEHRLKRRISTMSKIFNICIMSMRSVVPPKKKKKLGHSHSNFRKLRLKHFPLTNIRDIIKPELSLTQVRII